MYINKGAKRIFSVILILMLLGAIGHRRLLMLEYPLKYDDLVEEYAAQNHLDKYFVYAVIKAESRFNPEVVSKKRAKGLMQISDDTAIWAANKLGIKEYDIFDPETNIKIGCWYLGWLSEKFKSDEQILAAYNAGPGNVMKWLANKDVSHDGIELNNIPFKETSNYRYKVQRAYRMYKYIYDNEEM